MVGDRNRVAPIRRIAPVDAPKIVRMRRVGVNVGKAGGDMWGIGAREESCANVGSTIFCARARSIAERRITGSTIVGASASPM